MNSKMLTYVTLLVIFNSLMVNVSGRICACSFFNEEACNDHSKCEWNPNRPTTGIVQGSVGKCRTKAYMDCKRNPECTLKNNDPRVQTSSPSPPPVDQDNVESILSAYTKKMDMRNKLKADSDPANDQYNGQDPEESYDWPYDCIELEIEREMAKKAEAEAEAEAEIVADIDAEYYTENINANPGVDVDAELSAYKSFSGLEIGAGIVCVILLLSAMCYWQCNKNKMNKNIKNSASDHEFIALNDGQNYSTFDNI